VDLDLLLLEVSRTHSGTPRSVGHLWMSEWPVAETSTCQCTIPTRDKTPMPLAAFEVAIPALVSSRRPTP